MKEVNHYKDVAILTQGSIAFGDLTTEQVQPDKFKFHYHLTRGRLNAKVGEVISLKDLQRHYDVLTDGQGFSRS